MSGTSKERNFNPKFYATGQPNRCPVMKIKTFIKHSPDVMKNESDPFYVGVIHQLRSNIWLKTSKLGERSLCSAMENMADAVELLGKKCPTIVPDAPAYQHSDKKIFAGPLA